jgi:inosine-uridine nucleoside N-ribohydrolase
MIFVSFAIAPSSYVASYTRSDETNHQNSSHMTRIHLDTDIGGDPDDVCALALLLAHPDVALTGITTNLDDYGERAGCAELVLALTDQRDIPVYAGASRTMTDGRVYASTADDERYWPAPPTPKPAPIDGALDALAGAVARGDTIVTIGALTNLALLEQRHAGVLATARVVVMGGWLQPPAPGLPQWGPERDFNIQCDPLAAAIALDAIGDLTIATLPALAAAHLRAAHLPRLGASGTEIGRLIARQAEVYAIDTDRAALTRDSAGLPSDLLNFHWDPVTCAIAAGWNGATVTERAIAWTIDTSDGVLRMRDEPVSAAQGRMARVVDAIDGEAFGGYFLDTVVPESP